LPVVPFLESPSTAPRSHLTRTTVAGSLLTHRIPGTAFLPSRSESSFRNSAVAPEPVDVLVEEAQRRKWPVQRLPTASPPVNDVVIIRLVTHCSGFWSRPTRRRVHDRRAVDHHRSARPAARQPPCGRHDRGPANRGVSHVSRMCVMALQWHKEPGSRCRAAMAGG
jgi:hypothetical protein